VQQAGVGAQHVAGGGHVAGQDPDLVFQARGEIISYGGGGIRKGTE
jgi:hypothetical protein